MKPTGFSFSVCMISLVLAMACVRPAATAHPSTELASRDTIDARGLFEANIDAIHKRDRARYLATYLHSDRLARNGPGGLELGYNNWSARNDTTWPDTLIASNLRVVPISAGVIYGSYCYTVSQHDTTSSGVSERIFVKTADGWRIAVTTAFGLPPAVPAQCK
jgi:hypothetical protein